MNRAEVRILRLLVDEEPDLTIAEITERLGYHHDYARKRCKTLRDKDLVDFYRCGHPLKYTISDRGRALLDGDLDPAGVEEV